VVPDQTQFERLLAELSTRFSGVAGERVDREIDRALRQLTEFLDADRCSFAEPRADGATIVVTHSWARPSFEALTQSFPLPSVLPWLHRRIQRGEVVRLESLDDLPETAIAEREYARSLGIRSHLSVPLSIGGKWVCAIGTLSLRESRRWPDATVHRIRIVGQILANALYRRNIEVELRESLREVRRLQRRLEAENEYLREEIESDAGFEQIVGKSRALREVLEQAAQVAPTSATVLLLGETGTGKELLARAIHARSKRAERPLIKVNCAALPPSLIESELFGHEKGAFTGATSSKPGRFELADGGTLFLDEVGEIPPEVQAKLLRVLQDGEFERLGATRSRKVDVRIVAATNRDLEQAIAAGRFREDLYYRLAAFPIRLPPLRDRREDIPLLVWDCIRRRQGELGREIERVPESAMLALTSYSWPGNVRELGNVIERALILSHATALRLDAAFAGAAARRGEPSERLDDVERAHFLRVLERHGWRIDGSGNAAAALGLHPNTLRSRLKKLGVARPSARSSA
jgi:transcriptional regulator with GAF, ATPase, and Fis domain